MKTAIVLCLALGGSAEQTALSNIWHPANCCQSLVDAGFQNVYMPNHTLYSERVESYWSLTSRLTPECFIQPRDTKEVAGAVEVLLRETECPFAVRSGGHSSTAGANNIEKAVAIDLGLLNKMTYDFENSIASVGPGARWLDVYRTLDEYNVGVLGGRIGTVGVGGLLRTCQRLLWVGKLLGTGIFGFQSRSKTTREF
ncbi:hypothetical protein FJTKL_07477 [Diaporthe vaccinii]|uniref:FAD-binding PCMH-type domain-containing protein n=2 Tax=Diaporthe vaccinii TaxID=105482 RepID=A0ABR4EU10_9PEZI